MKKISANFLFILPLRFFLAREKQKFSLSFFLQVAFFIVFTCNKLDSRRGTLINIKLTELPFRKNRKLILCVSLWEPTPGGESEVKATRAWLSSFHPRGLFFGFGIPVFECQFGLWFFFFFSFSVRLTFSVTSSAARETTGFYIFCSPINQRKSAKKHLAKKSRQRTSK